MDTEESALLEDIAVLKESEENGIDGVDPREKSTWDLSGILMECVEWYAKFLTDKEMNEILLGIEAGLSEKQVKNYFCLTVKKWNNTEGCMWQTEVELLCNINKNKK